MAPTTRLGVDPSRRTNYAESTARMTTAGTVRPTAGPQTSEHSTPKTAKAALPEKIECTICSSEKGKRAFNLRDGRETCGHFTTICNICVAKMVKTKIVDRKLTDALLACPFPGCNRSLDMDTIRKASKSTWTTLEEALTKHFLNEDANFVACLNTKCGRSFSVEECRRDSNADSKHKITCPHCDYDMCLTCNRPLHRSKNCNKAKQELEDKQSEATIKKLGAKPCPKCTAIIERNGGCPHMTCKVCGHHFCWHCLAAPYTFNGTHANDCPVLNQRPLIEQPGAFVPDEITDAQLNHLIELTARGLANAIRRPAQAGLQRQALDQGLLHDHGPMQEPRPHEPHVPLPRRRPAPPPGEPPPIRPALPHPLTQPAQPVQPVHNDEEPFLRAAAPSPPLNRPDAGQPRDPRQDQLMPMFPPLPDGFNAGLFNNHLIHRPAE